MACPPWEEVAVAAVREASSADALAPRALVVAVGDLDPAPSRTVVVAVAAMDASVALASRVPAPSLLPVVDVPDPDPEARPVVIASTNYFLR